jgi:chromosome segregation ATPase
LEAERSELQNEMTVVSDLLQKCIEENARYALDQAEYKERYDGLTSRYEAATARLDEVSGLIMDKRVRLESLEAFIKVLKKQDGLITEFDEQLWYSLMDSPPSTTKWTCGSGSRMGRK